MSNIIDFNEKQMEKVMKTFLKEHDSHLSSEEKDIVVKKSIKLFNERLKLSNLPKSFSLRIAENCPICNENKTIFKEYFHGMSSLALIIIINLVYHDLIKNKLGENKESI